MRVILAHRIELVPNARQRQFFAECVGVARFAYNWALDEWEKQYKAGEKPNEAALRRQLNAIKREKYPWMLRVPKSVPQQAIKNLGDAFKRFFRKEASYPQFKKKYHHDSARLDNGPGTFQCQGKRIRLPLIGWVKMREALRFQGKALSATISREADRWYVSIAVEVEKEPPVRESQAAVGVDLGVETAATLSTGEKLQAPKSLAKNLRKLKRLSRWHSRKKPGSHNRRKSAMRLARLHRRIASIRRDWLHKTTTMLARNYGIIGIETLNVKGMMANEYLSRAIADIGVYEFKCQLRYKAALYGAVVVEADQWYPSSKTCSCCGHKVDTLPLSVRRWMCPACGTEHDRDENAAKNLERLALATASSAGSYACGHRRLQTERSVPVVEAGIKPCPEYLGMV